MLAEEAKDMRERGAILIDRREATRLFHQSVIFEHSLFIIANPISFIAQDPWGEPLAFKIWGDFARST